MAGFSAIVSLMLNFSAQENVGLATQTTNCEWIAESAIEGAETAVSASVAVAASTAETVSLPAGLVHAIAIKNVGGDQCNVSLAPGLSVNLVAGASFAFSGRIPSGTLSLLSAAGTTVEIVAIVGS